MGMGSYKLLLTVLDSYVQSLDRRLFPHHVLGHMGYRAPRTHSDEMGSIDWDAAGKRQAPISGIEVDR